MAGTMCAILVEEGAQDCVSMESGLDGRNNEIWDESPTGGAASQWSPA